MPPFHPGESGHGYVDYSDDEQSEIGDFVLAVMDAMDEQAYSTDEDELPTTAARAVPAGTRRNDTSDSDDSVVMLDGEHVAADSESIASSDTEDSSDSDEEMSDKEESKSASSEAKRVIDDYDPEDEDDEVVKKILTELRKPRSKPPNITTDDFPTDLSFHPDTNILAVGTIMGDVLIYRYENEENKLIATHEVHTKAIRDIEFSSDGKDLFSGGKDKSIMMTDIETGKLKRFWEQAHADPIYTMTVIDENLLASGDEEGTVRLWDCRIKGGEPIFSIKKVEDYITSIITNDAKRMLVCTSGDGFLTTINIGSKKMYVQSEQYEEELTCAGIYRSESKVVVGTSKGNFYTFNWGEFGYHNDAFSAPGPSSPIAFMVPITEHICVTGGEEGVLRAMHLVPGRILGVVGQHQLAVESLDICNDGEFIASSSHDNDIRFWNIKYFEDFDDIKYNAKPNKKAAKHNLPSSLHANRSDFFADLAE